MEIKKKQETTREPFVWSRMSYKISAETLCPFRSEARAAVGHGSSWQKQKESKDSQIISRQEPKRRSQSQSPSLGGSRAIIIAPH